MRPRLQAPAASEITHTRFLVSAERLFCVHGYEGTKIRAIAKLSNANLGMLSTTGAASARCSARCSSGACARFTKSTCAASASSTRRCARAAP